MCSHYNVGRLALHILHLFTWYFHLLYQVIPDPSFQTSVLIIHRLFSNFITSADLHYQSVVPVSSPSVSGSLSASVNLQELRPCLPVTLQSESCDRSPDHTMNSAGITLHPLGPAGVSGPGRLSFGVVCEGVFGAV